MGSGDLDYGRGVLLCVCGTGGIGHWRSDLAGNIVADPAFAAGGTAIRAEPRTKGDALQGLHRRSVETVCRRLRARAHRDLKPGETIRHGQPDAHRVLAEGR